MVQVPSYVLIHSQTKLPVIDHFLSFRLAALEGSLNNSKLLLSLTLFSEFPMSSAYIHAYSLILPGNLVLLVCYFRCIGVYESPAKHT